MNVLEKICERKKEYVARQRAARPLAALKSALDDMAPAAPGFVRAIRDNPDIALIAEIKKASPSAGIIRPDFDPATIARQYEQAGAACLSVLTDTPSFQGRNEYIACVKAVTALPVLRKDFIVDLYQIYETKALGADCLLLIMAALSDAQAAEFYQAAKETGLDVLVETHDAEEVERALQLKPDMVGINSRNLKTLEVDLGGALKFAGALPDDIIKVAESGIKSHDNVKTLSDSGFDAILVGESLMKERDIEKAARTLLGKA